MDDSKSSSSRNGVQAAETAAMVLDVFSRNPGALKLKQIAEITGIAAPKIHRYLVSMTNSGLVEQDSDSTRYRLGPLALRLGLSALSQIDVVKLSATTLTDLRDELNETVALMIWAEGRPTVVRWEESSAAVTVNVRIGSGRPLLSSASGRVFLAYLPREQLAPRIAEELHKHPGFDVEACIQDVRSKGVATIKGDLLPGVAAAAAPVFDHRGNLVAALTAMGYEGVFELSSEGDRVKRLKAAAAQLSDRLGYTPAE